MKLKNTIILLSILSIFIVTGCEQETKYVCPDGRAVSFASECRYCGDDVCDVNSEDKCICPEDCDGSIVPKCPGNRPYFDQKSRCCAGFPST